MRICIVDDDVSLSKALKLHLQDNSYAVDSFTEARKSHAHLQMNHVDYDLIILDWMMSDITGLDLCKKLRDHGVTIPILMLTAVNNIENKVAALDAGADDYLTKPFPVPELLARIRSLLRRPKEGNSPILHVGNLSLTTATHTVTMGERIIPLTLKEFSILEYLMLHNNQVIGRDKILDHVWDMGYVSFSNIIDVRINGLRKKLGSDGSTLIKTIRGVGYKLEYDTSHKPFNTKYALSSNNET